MAQSRISFNLIDHSSETSGPTIYIQDPAADGSDFTEYSSTATPGTLYTDLKAAIAALSSMNFKSITLNLEMEDLLGTIPADADAQREVAIRCYYRSDVTGKLYSFSVPGVKRSEFAVSNLDEIPLTDPKIAALKAIIDVYGRDEFGNGVTMERVVWGGRAS